MFPYKVHISRTDFPGFLYAVPVRDTDARCSKYPGKKSRQNTDTIPPVVSVFCLHVVIRVRRYALKT